MTVYFTNRYVVCCRYFSRSTVCLNLKKKKYVKYPSELQEPYSERNAAQKLANLGRKLIPFDKNLPVTGKKTGRHVEGGSDYGEKIAAKHGMRIFFMY